MNGNHSNIIALVVKLRATGGTPLTASTRPAEFRLLRAQDARPFRTTHCHFTPSSDRGIPVELACALLRTLRGKPERPRMQSVSKEDAIALVSAGYMSMRVYLERFGKRKGEVISLSDWARRKRVRAGDAAPRTGIRAAADRGAG